MYSTNTPGYNIRLYTVHNEIELTNGIIQYTSKISEYHNM